MQSYAYGPETQVYKDKVNNHFKAREPKSYEVEIREVYKEHEAARLSKRAACKAVQFERTAKEIKLDWDSAL